MIILIILALFGCSKQNKKNEVKYAIAGTINTLHGYPDTLAGAIIRIKNISENSYISDGIVKINDTIINYNATAFGYVAILNYKKNQNYKIYINFQNYEINLDCLSNNLDSVKIYIDRDSVNRGENININWKYYNSPSGYNMVLLRKGGSIEFSYGSGYIPIEDTSYILNTSNLGVGDYDLLLISGNFCIIDNLEPYPNFPNSLIFLGRGANKVIKIRSKEFLYF